MNDLKQAHFISAFLHVQTEVHRTAVSKGWWDEPRSGGAQFCNLHGHVSDGLEAARKDNFSISRLTIGIESSLRNIEAGVQVPAEVEELGTCIALMHSELSEAWTGVWANHQDTGEAEYPASTKIPAFNCVEEEFADVIIRIMDYCERHGLDVTGAIVAKAEYNQSRPHRHGDKAF